MIFIYGDSHGIFGFNNLSISHRNLCEPSITMFRIGRDNIIINFNKEMHDSESIICMAYGEVDCRCHIQRQIDAGKDEDDIICDLVHNYFLTIRCSTERQTYKQIIIVGVVPPTKQEDCEKYHGKITHDFPFVGTDSDRVRYTNKINIVLKTYCNIYKYTYFNPYQYYTLADGTLNHTLSDTNVHIGDNTHFLDKFMEIISYK